MVRKLVVAAMACVGVMLVGAGVASAQYGPTNWITVAPTAVAPGGAVTVRGCCFQSGSSVTITLRSDPVVVGSAVADGAGIVEQTVTIPSDTVPGPHSIELSGTGADGNPLVLTAGIEVTGTTTTGSSGALPVTGSSNTGLFAGVGVCLIAIGALVVLATRGRSKRSTRAPV